VTRVAVAVVASVAALFTAPAALAATFTVRNPGAANDAGAQAACAAQPSTAGCTLPAALATSDTAPGSDTIAFAVDPGPFGTGDLPPVGQPVLIDGGGNTTVSFAGTATGLLLNVQAANTTIKSIEFTGGASSATVLNLAGAGDRLDTVTVRNAPGTAVRIAGGSVRVDSSRVDTSGTGIAVAGSSATIASPTITGSSGRGIDITGTATSVVSPEISGSGSAGIVAGGGGAAISGGRIHGNAGDGVLITGQNNTVGRVVFFGNGGKPIATAPGANGGIAPPQNLRVGPRRADGSLPLSGTASGTVELWSGNPASASAPSFVDAFGAGGDFTYSFPTEPQPGSVFSATVTGGSGTSEFATVTVPGDISSPMPSTARATDTANVRIDFSEPLDPTSVQKEDFRLTMAGKERAISSLAVAPDGTFVTLTSSGWKSGEAGYVDVTAPGAVNDAAGNAMVIAPRLRVAAAPGDFLAPLGARLRVSPKTICLTRGRKCRRTGMIIKFISSEAGKARLLIKRSNKTVGSRLYGNIVAGPNTLKWNGRLGSRKLRAGRYRLLMYIQDQVGNVTDRPPIVLFNVRRVTR
jgi:Right handed beta helix region/Bacterial Ig-like domain